MPLPRPEPGLVIRYDYLWLHDIGSARVAGKERPACIVATLDNDITPHLVLILPITHSQPKGETVGVEIPLDVAHKLGLDAARSWIVISEANVDFWPNAGLAPVPGSRGAFAYGFLPPVLFETVRKRFTILLAKRRSKLVRR
jgi:hypothetical protein